MVVVTHFKAKLVPPEVAHEMPFGVYRGACGGAGMKWTVGQRASDHVATGTRPA
jgi:hypothetical protein